MDFQKKGWLKRYLYLRNNYALIKEYDRLVNMEKDSVSPENLLYELLQPSGLLYGHPAQIPIVYKSLLRALRADKLSDKDKTKIILTESFLNSGLISPRYREINQKVDVADALLESAIHIGKFYHSLYPLSIGASKRGLFRREMKGLELSENLIDQRVEKKSGEQKFWKEFFRSSLFFLDVVHFGRWLHAHKNKKEGEKILEDHQKDRLLAFKIIVAAAYANQILEPEEKVLLQNYLAVAQFDEKTNKHALKIIDSGVNLTSLKLGKIDSPTMKRHLMELAILTVCADRDVNEEEEVFLEQLRARLHLEKELFNSSEVAVESFLLENWQKLAHQQDDNRVNHLGKQLQKRIHELIMYDELAFKEAINKNPVLQKLLLKMQHEKLSAENRTRIRQELIAVINGLPSLSGIALPRTFLTFPRLMEIFPGDYFIQMQDQPPK